MWARCTPRQWREAIELYVEEPFGPRALEERIASMHASSLGKKPDGSLYKAEELLPGKKRVEREAPAEPVRVKFKKG